MTVKRASGVRKYQERSLRQRWQQWRASSKLALAGDGLFLEQDVHLMRHPEKIWLSDNVIVKSGARICPTNPDAEVRIGKWTTVGYHTYLFATTSITIGDNCLVAPFVYIVDANHGIKREVLIREQSMSAAPIHIADDVWIGTNAVILKGVKIGTGAVISAGAIVSCDVPEYAIVSGNPAKIVEDRR